MSKQPTFDETSKMNKAEEMAKVSAKGSFHLLLGLVISTLISSLIVIFLARILGSDQYGLYGIVLIAPNLIGVFRDWGIDSAMIKFIAQFRSEGRESEIRSVIFSGLIFETSLGIILSVISFALSGYLATEIFHRPQLATLIQIASITILTSGLTNTATAIFTGIEKMHLCSAMLICQSILRTAIMVSLVLLGLGTPGAIWGYTAAMLLTASIAFSIILKLYKPLPKTNGLNLEIKAYIKTMLTYSTPLSLSLLINSFQIQFFTFLLPIFYVTNNSAIANYAIATTFASLIAFFATPISTVLFPAFSKLNPQKDKQALQNVFQYSVKYAALLVVPVAALLMCLAQPAVTTLFGTAYPTAALFLTLLSINYTLTAFGSLTTNNFINSQGKTTFLLYVNLITVAIGVPLGYVLIMNYGVIGLIIASIVSVIPAGIILSLYWINKNYGLTIDWRSSAKILFSSAIAALTTYALISILSFPSIIILAIGTVFFISVFILSTILTKALNNSDLQNLRTMTSGLGVFAKLLNRILDLIEKIMESLKLTH